MAEGVLAAPSIGLGRRWSRVERLLRSNVCAFMVLVVVPIPIYVLEINHAVTGVKLASDFLSFWKAGRSILHGQSPYPLVSSLPKVARPLSFEPFVYPAPAAFWMAPFALLPFTVATSLFLFMSWGSVSAALLLLGVRDWRCHAVTIATVPIVAGTALGSFSPWLLLGAAAVWRYRDRARIAGPILALLVVAKVFLWPLWFWLVFTRRYAAAVASLVLGLVVTAGAWAVLGFAGLREYPQLLSRLTHLVGVKSYSPFALLHAIGLSVGNAQRVVSLLAIAILIACAHRFRGRRADVPAFVAMLGLSLFATPVLWPHYFALMFVPIAFARKTFSWLWALPLLLWFRGTGWSYGDPALIVPALLVASVPFVLMLRDGPT